MAILKLMVSLAVVLLMKDFSTDACGGVTCTANQGDCINDGTNDVCYCRPEFMGADCTTACGACTNSEVCITDATSCGACTGCDATRQKCATVVDAAACRCIDGLSGTNCETITCSVGNPCQNSGTCDTDACTCDKDHAGPICEKECDPACTAGTHKCVESSGNPVCKATCAADTDCANGGTCTDDLCTCATGWEGDLCDQEVLVCDPVCTAVQKCVEEDGTNVCKATCANNAACLNGGTCANELCNCAEGWTGDLCADSGVSSVVPSVLPMALFMLVILL